MQQNCHHKHSLCTLIWCVTINVMPIKLINKITCTYWSWRSSESVKFSQFYHSMYTCNCSTTIRIRSFALSLLPCLSFMHLHCYSELKIEILIITNLHLSISHCILLYVNFDHFRMLLFSERCKHPKY